jgi:NADH-quinone oxidoreductase subunit C
MSDSAEKSVTAPAKEEAAKPEKSPTPIYTGYDLDYFVAPGDLPDAARKLDQADFFLEDISCVDMQEGFQIVYHFDRFDQPGRVGLRVMLDRETPEIPSIHDIYPGANWHERECFDFFGIIFTGHPNLLPLLLDPDHQGPPPLIKKESDRKDLNELYPDRVHTPVDVRSEKFVREITNCSNPKYRNPL